jgi:hypothetical protein
MKVQLLSLFFLLAPFALALLSGERATERADEKSAPAEASAPADPSNATAAPAAVLPMPVAPQKSAAPAPCLAAGSAVALA